MRVLTIDLDYVTTDYARFSENYNFSQFAGKRWDDLILDTPVHPYDFKIDSSNLLYIIDVFTRSIELCENVVFGKEHESILYELESCEDEIDLINIDQHHDIAYRKEHIDNIEKYNIVSEGSWIWYLYRKNLISSYKWIKTETSVSYNKDKPSFGIKRGFTYQLDSLNLPPFDVPFIEGLKTDFADWDDFEFDLIYISESPQYVFPEHWVYAELLKVIYKNRYHKLPKQIDQKYMWDFSKHKPPSMIDI